jgi:phage baseplate assembly protein V
LNITFLLIFGRPIVIDREARGRIGGMITRCRVALSNAASKIQTLQVYLQADSGKDSVEHLENYGLTSRPLPDAEGIVITVGGDASHGVVICVGDRRYRLQGLEEGDVALYNDTGSHIILGRDELIVASCKTFRVVCDVYEVQAKTSASFETPNLNASAQVNAAGLINGSGGLAVAGGGGAKVEGSLEATGDIKAGDVSLRKHPHKESTGGQTGSALGG